MKVSVIIPYHNVQKELFEWCIYSIESQTFQDFEVLVVNDGSSDEYLPLLTIIEKRDSRFRVITQECKGASAARNYGVAEARGEYIAFIDADDMVMPNFLEEALMVIEENCADMVAGGVRFIFGLQNMIPAFNSKQEKLNEGDILTFDGMEIDGFKNHLVSSRQLIRYSGGNVNRGPVSRLVKRELAKSCLFHEDLIMWEDLTWNLELLNMCKKVCAVPRTWYLYYQNPDSQIHRYRPNVIREVETTMEYIERLLDLDADDGYEAFGDHICDNLRRVYKLYFSRKECTLTYDKRTREYERIYTSEPWIIFGSDRYYKLSGGKNRILSFFYRRKVFFAIFDIKEKIKAKLKIH